MAQDDEDVSGPDEIESDSDESAAGAAPTQAPISPVLQQYLQSKQKMAQAQAQADQNSKYSGLARAAATLSAGLAGSNQAVNQQPFNELDAEAKAPVANVLNEQKTAMNDLATQGKLRDAEKSEADTDPNSPQSVAAKALIKKLYPGKYDASIDALSAADIGDSIMKPLELDQKIQAAKEAHEDKLADRNQASIDRAHAKTDSEHERYVQHIEDSEKGWRSDPASTRFDAMMGATATGKSLIDKYRGHEDDMPIQDIHALVSDRLKAITGATPTEQEIAAQMPHTLKTRWAGTKSFFTGSPEPAGAGDFVRNIDSSFQEMEQKARAGLLHRQQSVANSPRLSQEERDRLVQIGVPEASYKPAGQAPIANHPQDANAIAWANNPKSKGWTQQKAAAILRANGQDSPQGFAYGGSVGGLPSSNYAASQMSHTQHLPALHLHAPRGYADGGAIPGQPGLPQDNPVNDKVQIMATPKEVVLPLHVTQAKDPALAAYLFMKQLHGKVR